MAAIYINGKLCSGGTELVEEVQEGLTEAVTSDAVARYIKPVVQNVTSGVTNPVSSGAVYGALTNYPNKVNFTSKGNTQFELDVSPYINKCILIGYINSYSGDHIELMIYYSGYAIMETTLSKLGNATVSKDGNIVTLSDPGYIEGGLCKPFGIVLP